MDILERILQRLNVPSTARLVYLDLIEHGGSPARAISLRVSLTRPSVYDQLKILKDLGLVVERDLDGKTEFLVHDLQDLEKLMQDERLRLESLEKEWREIRPALAAKTAKNAGTQPKIKFLGGREPIIRSMHDMLWDESQVLQVVWPYRHMLRTLGKKALEEFNEKRLRQNIRLQTIWMHGEDDDRHIWQGAGDRGVERRRAPAGINPEMGYTVYDHKVLFVSSATEAFGFVVQSRDFANLMRLQFELLWKIAKPEKKTGLIPSKKR